MPGGNFDYSRRRFMGRNFVDRQSDQENALDDLARKRTAITGLDDLSNNLGDITAGRFISPSDPDILDPEDAAYSGTVNTGQGITIGGVTYSVIDLLLGVLNFGIIPGTGATWAGGEGQLDKDGAKLQLSTNSMTPGSEDEENSLSWFDGAFGTLSNKKASVSAAKWAVGPANYLGAWISALTAYVMAWTKNTSTGFAGIFGHTSGGTPVYVQANGETGQIECSHPVNAPNAKPPVRKASNESVTSSTTLQDDDALAIPMEASHTYNFVATLYCQGAATGDIKFGWSLPSGATMQWQEQSAANAAAVAGLPSVVLTESDVLEVGAAGSGTVFMLIVRGTVVNSTTAGNATLQWAQRVSDATASMVMANSSITYERIT